MGEAQPQASRADMVKARERSEGIPAPRVRAIGLCSGWGRGAAAVPADARAAAAGRPIISMGRPTIEGERFRRATRECLWALAAVEAMLEDGQADRGEIEGDGTALLFATAAVYGASNRAFIEGTGGGTHFAYTAPAVISAEAAIEFGLRGPAVLFIGGPPAALRAIWYAATLLAGGACDRALVLAVETFEECADLYARVRRRTAPPLVEAAACLWLEPGDGRLELRTDRARRAPAADGARRRGEMLACGPLAEVALRRHAGHPDALGLSGAWRGEVADLIITKGGG
jgi:Beta-ketoacyl synthase, N-terminal domain